MFDNPTTRLQPLLQSFKATTTATRGQPREINRRHRVEKCAPEPSRSNNTEGYPLRLTIR